MAVADDVDAAGRRGRDARDRAGRVRAAREHLRRRRRRAARARAAGRARRPRCRSRTRLPATIERSGGERTTPRAVHRAEVDGAGVARHVAGDHPQPVEAVGRSRAALAVVGGQLTASARARRPTRTVRTSARALPHLEPGPSAARARARRRSRDRRGNRSRARSRGARRSCRARARSVSSVSGLSSSIWRPDRLHLHPVGAVGPTFPSASRPFQRATTRPPGCGSAPRSRTTRPPGATTSARTGPRGVDAEAHLAPGGRARCSAARTARCRGGRAGRDRGSASGRPGSPRSAIARASAPGRARTLLPKRRAVPPRVRSRLRAASGGSYVQERPRPCRSPCGCDDASSCPRPR